MTLKSLDKTFDTALWIIFILLAVGSWFAAEKFCAPTYEVAESTYTVPNNYTTDDGDVVQSTYVTAWMHSNFESPKAVFYDTTLHVSTGIKDEYVAQVVADMPESQYKAFYYRWFWVIFALLVIVSAIVVYFGGGAIRDLVLCSSVKGNPTFDRCAYFLYHDRICCRKAVEALVPASINNYIGKKIPTLAQRYSPSFVVLISKLLDTIRLQGNTEIKFYLSYLDNVKPQLDFLKERALYWQDFIGKHPKAQEYVEHLNSLRQQSYVPYSSNVTAEDVSTIVTLELRQLFTEVMGEEIFRFVPYSSTVREMFHSPGDIFVKVEVLNSSSTFTWSGSEYSGKKFPGVDIKITIYHYSDGKKEVLWEKFLDPVCDYKAEDLNVTDLYANMIKGTIRTFNASMKK